MFVEVFMFLYYAAYLGLGYGVPIVLAAMAFVSGDKSRMSRWLIHFLILNVLEYTVFPILDFIGLCKYYSNNSNIESNSWSFSTLSPNICLI